MSSDTAPDTARDTAPNTTTEPQPPRATVTELTTPRGIDARGFSGAGEPPPDVPSAA